MSAPLAPISILDDDASVLRAIERLLKSDGFAARTFERAGEFLAHAQEHMVKLAVLDVSMRQASGLEVQAQLREFSPHTRVIAVTTQDQPGLRAAALKNGANAFLLKPFEDEIFLAHVREALDVAS